MSLNVPEIHTTRYSDGIKIDIAGTWALMSACHRLLHRFVYGFRQLRHPGQDQTRRDSPAFRFFRPPSQGTRIAGKESCLASHPAGGEDVIAHIIPDNKGFAGHNAMTPEKPMQYCFQHPRRWFCFLPAIGPGTQGFIKEAARPSGFRKRGQG